jgi:hypothetical protein
MWHVVSIIGELQLIASSRRSRTVPQDPLPRASLTAAEALKDFTPTERYLKPLTELEASTFLSHFSDDGG